jgi:Uri superfamily endonuclease
MRLFVLRRIALRGTYTLLLACKRPFKLRIGRLGQVRLKKGHYLYTGSALGSGAASLEERVARHRRHNKCVRWHVDYLTVRSEIIIVNAICLRASKRLECQINQQISFEFSGKPIIKKAGASDCKCDGHLLSTELLDSKVIMTRLKHVYAMHGEFSFL